MHGDGPDDVDYIARKIAQLRIFRDDAGRMNRAITDVGGQVLLISQFTLAARKRKGRRPGFTDAAPPAEAVPLCDAVVAALDAAGITVAQGSFGAMMDVTLTNDGPVTILLDSRNPDD
jgi:D-tyrosyl-tRNA(Tyr) deacylase